MMRDATIGAAALRPARRHALRGWPRRLLGWVMMTSWWLLVLLPVLAWMLTQWLGVGLF